MNKDELLEKARLGVPLSRDEYREYLEHEAQMCGFAGFRETPWRDDAEKELAMMNEEEGW